MLCGTDNIWPQPTIKSLISNHASNFKLHDIQYRVQTPFRNVEMLMDSAFAVFLGEIKHIEQASSESSSGDSIHKNHHEKRHVASDEIETVHPHSSSEPQFYRKMNLTTVNIYINVIKSPDVHLTMTPDECYNITMTSEIFK